MTLAERVLVYRKYANVPFALAIFLIYVILHRFGIFGAWVTAGYITSFVVAGYYSGRLAERDYANPLILMWGFATSIFLWIGVLYAWLAHLAHLNWWFISSTQFGLLALVYVGFVGYFNTVSQHTGR